MYMVHWWHIHMCYYADILTHTDMVSWWHILTSPQGHRQGAIPYHLMIQYSRPQYVCYIDMVSWWQILTCPQRHRQGAIPYHLILQYSRPQYVYMVHWWNIQVSLCRYINLYRHGVMVADSYKSTGAQIGSHTYSHTYSTVCVLYRYSVMVADSYMSTGTQIGSHTLPPYDIVQQAIVCVLYR